MISERDNNGNADDADLADCRGFAERDARRDNNGNAKEFEKSSSHLWQVL